jgi:hypothetical protein
MRLTKGRCVARFLSFRIDYGSLASPSRYRNHDISAPVSMTNTRLLARVKSRLVYQRPEDGINGANCHCMPRER